MNWNIKQNAFIKLTQNDGGLPVWISAEKIISIEEIGECTKVSVCDDFFFVKETAKEIFEMMNYGN